MKTRFCTANPCCRAGSHDEKHERSTRKLDVLIPAVPKDLATLPLVIDAVRQQVRHPIGHIFVVAPAHPRMLALCRRKKVTFIDERAAVPFSKHRFRYRSKTWDLSGWLLQQMIKLNGDKLCTSDHFLVIDADTVLIRPHIFIRNGKTVFYCRNWSRPEYFRTAARLLGRKRAAKRSFVTHYMLFNRRQLSLLKQSIEARHGVRWHEAIWRAMDKSKRYAFSEFETYGNFLYARMPGQVQLLPARNKAMRLPAARLSKDARRKLARSYRSLSFHQRSAYRRKEGGAAQ